MPYTSDPYTKTVCACLRYATAKEKAAVQAELEAHIEDHTEALLAAGYNAWPWRPWEIPRTWGRP